MEKIRVDTGSAAVQMVRLKERHGELERRLARAGAAPVAHPGRAGRAQPFEEREAAHEGRATAPGRGPRSMRLLRRKRRKSAANGRSVSESPSTPPSSSGSGARAFASIARGASSTKAPRCPTTGCGEALFRWLDRLPPPDGRYVLRLDERGSPTSTSTTRRSWRARRGSIDGGDDLAGALRRRRGGARSRDADHRRRRRAAWPGCAAAGWRRAWRPRPWRRSATCSRRRPADVRRYAWRGGRCELPPRGRPEG